MKQNGRRKSRLRAIAFAFLLHGERPGPQGGDVRGVDAVSQKPFLIVR